MNQDLLEKLETLANKSPMKERYGAILIFRNKIIGMGYNDYRGKYRKIYNQCLL